MCLLYAITHDFWPRLRQLGCLIALGNQFLVRATMIYIILAGLGKYKLEVSLYQSYHSSYKHQKSCFNLIANHQHILTFLTLHILFCYSGMFGQAVLWSSLPNRTIQKRENCRSLVWPVDTTGHISAFKSETKRFNTFQVCFSIPNCQALYGNN